MNGPFISTRRRLEYTRGYLELGLLAEAERELAEIPAEEQQTPDFLEAKVDVHMETKRWDDVVAAASALCALKPICERAWIAWAYALRERQEVTKARDVLLQAEPLHGATCGVLHYNLACYYCLLGDMEEAERRLDRACRMDPNWRAAALDDPDLKPMRTRLIAED